MGCGSTVPFAQTTFLGASIVRFSSQIDWSGTGGGLQVELVEDECNGDNFLPPKVGSPVWFSMGGFTQGGILQNWEQTDSATGAKTYIVNIADPFEIVDGCQVILSNYTGSVLGMPNLINAHGWIEAVYGTNCDNDLGFTGTSPGFSSYLTYIPAPGFTGNTYSNEIGISWNTLRLALTTILSGNGNWYGNKISFMGYEYSLDLSEVPTVSGDVFIGGDSMSLADIISYVCNMFNIEFFYELIITDSANVIKVRTGFSSLKTSAASAIAMNSAESSNIESRLNLGTISSAIENSTGVTSQSRGLELSPSTSNVFLTGDFRKEIWQMPYDGEYDGYTDTIWPYWGFDNNGSVIVGTGAGDGSFPDDANDYTYGHNFVIDMSDIFGVSGYWRVTEFELRAALAGETEWRAWLNSMETDKIELINGVSETTLRRQSSDTLDARLSAAGEKETLSFAQGDIGGIKGLDVQSWDYNAAGNISTVEEATYNLSKKIYEVVKNYASEFYGKKFMVKLYGICWRTSDVGILHNWELTDSAWTEWSVLGLSSSSWAMERFKEDDGKIKCFVKFMSDEPLVFDEISPSDYVLVNEYVAYVAATVEKVVWVTSDDPRAVISLNGRICKENPNGVLPENLLSFGAMGKYHDGDRVSLNTMTKGAGCDHIIQKMSEPAIMPISAAVPMQSKRLVYGPWLAASSNDPDFSTHGDYFSGGDEGKTHYERDTGFTPWNFGSFSTMNSSAFATVNTIYDDTYVAEMGQISVAGAPIGSIGSLIQTNGPIVSSIDVQIGRGDGPVVTSYRMRTHSKDTGQLARQRIEQIRNTTLKAIKNSREFKKQILEKYSSGINTPKATGKINMVSSSTSTGRRGNTTGLMMVAEAFTDPDGPSLSTTTGFSSRKTPDGNTVINTAQPAINEATSHEDEPHAVTSVSMSNGEDALHQSRGDTPHIWCKKAVMEFSGMFRPFSTLPHTGKANRDDSYCMSHWRSDINNDKVLEDGSTIDGETKISKSPSLTENFDFFQHEQVPPIEDEANLPINITTLSPFLSNGNSLVAGSSSWGTGGISMGSSAGHDIEYIARDGAYPTHLSIRQAFDDYSSSHWYRAVALKGPLVIAGWGYDIDNKPVPNSSNTYPGNPEASFEQDWLRKPQKWMCGPVDLRWDYKRNVWTAPSTMKVVRVKMRGDVSSGESGSGIIYNEQVQYDTDGNELSIVTDDEETSGYAINILCDRPVSKNDCVTAYFDTTKNKYVLNGGGSTFHIATLSEDIRLGQTVEAEVLYESSLETSSKIIEVTASLFESSWGTTDELGRVIPGGTYVGVSKNSDNGKWTIVAVSEISESSSSLSPSSTPSEESSSGFSSAPSDIGSDFPASSLLPDEGSSKSTAIVPATWTPKGFTALSVVEAPEVRFDDVLQATIPMVNMSIKIDPKFLEVCESNSIVVCGHSANKPVLMCAHVQENCVNINFAKTRKRKNVTIVVRLTGIRRGFAGVRFPDRTRKQFEQNEEFIGSAYDVE